MSDSEDIQEIREQKKEELIEQETAPDAPTEPVHVESEAHLEELVADHEVVLVDFYADWCGPCQMMEPAIEAVAADTEAVVAKVDVDEHQAMARANNVQGVPTMLVYGGGAVHERLVGAQDESTLRGLVEAAA